MNIVQKNKIQEISRFFLLTLGILSGVSLAIAPSQAVNIKQWKLDFFDESGNSMGSGSFSYDLDTITFIVTEPTSNPDPLFDGFFVQTELISFSANVLGKNWTLFDAGGQLWWEPSSQDLKGTIVGRGNISQIDIWFFGDRFFGEESLIMIGLNPGKWQQVTDFGLPVGTEDFGTWTTTQVPEPLTILGTGLALSLGLKFKHKKEILRRSLELK